MYPDPNHPQQLPRPELPTPQPLPENEYQNTFAQQPVSQDPNMPAQPQYLAPVPPQAYGVPYRTDNNEPQAWQQPTPAGPTYEQGMPPSADNPQLPSPQFPQNSVDYNNYSVETPHDDSDRKRVLWIVGIIAAVLVVAAIIALVVTLTGNDKKDNDATNKAAQDSTSQSNASGIAALRTVTLIPPADLSRYVPNPENSQYAMEYTTADGNCSLNLGVTDADVLPGKDLADIVARQMESARDQGMTLTGPSAGTPLELVNASDSTKKYSLPTLVFTTSGKDGTRIRSHYSAAVLADGKRVYITRICQSKTGDVAEDTLKPIDEDATRIVVSS